MLDRTAEPGKKAQSARTSLILWLVFFMLTPCMWGQHFSFAQFGQADGLLNQDVNAIVEDNRGVLWVGTENGIYRADGSHFVAYTEFRDAEYGVVLAMHADVHGRIWVLGSVGLAYIDRDGTLHRIPAFHFVTNYADHAVIVALPRIDDTEIVEVGKKLFRIQSKDGGKTWDVSPFLQTSLIQANPHLRQVYAIAADTKRGLLWAGCGDTICSIRTNGETVVVDIWNHREGVPSAIWTGLMVSRSGMLWGRSDRKVIRIDPEPGTIKDYGDPSGGTQPVTNYPNLAEDADGRIVTNLQDGVARIDNGAWHVITSKNGLPPSEMVRIFFDHGGSVWLCAAGAGVWRWLGYGAWEDWTQEEGLSSNVTWGLLELPDKTVLVANDNGLNRLDSQGGIVKVVSPDASLVQSNSLAHDGRGGVWIGTANGRLLHLDLATGQVRTIAEGLGVIYNLLSEDAGAEGGSSGIRRLWICTQHGLKSLGPEDHWNTIHSVQASGIPPGAEVFEAKSAHSGAVYFSTQAGFFQFRDSLWTRIDLPRAVVPIGQSVFSIALDDSVWIESAIPTPLVHLKIEGNRAEVLGKVSADIIRTDTTYFLKTDKRGWLWVGTDQGLYVFNGSRWIHCTQEDGLISDDTDTNGILADKDGSMWIGTARGISHLLHPEALFSVPPPRINISEVRLNHELLQAGVTETFDLRHPTLSAQLFTNEYLRPRAIRYQYRLLGLEDSWQPLNNRGVLFSSLPAGEYVLSIQAIDERLYSASASLDFPFTIQPPWWKRTWFRTLEAIFLSLLALLLWRLSVRQLKRSEAELKHQVDQRTAELLAEKQALEETQLELTKTMRRDSLTGLLNRGAIFTELERMRAEAAETKTPLLLCMADLDHFKSINDQYGHAAGDCVLRVCAERLMNILRPTDRVGRYGGEELLIAIAGLPVEHAMERLEELRGAICGSPIACGKITLVATCSFGATVSMEGEQEIETMLHAADEALYKAKQQGRNCVIFVGEGLPTPTEKI